MASKVAKGRSAAKSSILGEAGGGWDKKKSEYVWRDKGVTHKLEIKQPMKRPTSTSVDAIRRAIRDTNAPRKAK